MTVNSKGRELFIVDNSVSGWTGLRYLEEWSSIAKAFDIATGFFDIGALLALDGKWQDLDKIRILMGAETTHRTRKAILEAVRAQALDRLDESIEEDKEPNPFLHGVPAILDALRSGQIECRIYDKDKFHAKAYITHAKLEVVGAQALVGSSNFTRPSLTKNIELNVQIQSAREVAQLQEWFETHWNEANEVTEAVIETISHHTHLYSPFDVYAKALQQFFREHELTATEWDETRSRMFPHLDRYQKEAYWAPMQSFRRIRVLDLHGNLKKKEAAPGGGRDVNVFDIQQGVAIGLFTKAAAASRCVCHADLWGKQEQKYCWLWEHGSAVTEWVQLEPAPSFYLFEPFDDAATGAYYGWPAINEVMDVNVTGIVTARDDFVIDLKPSALLDRIETFLDNRLSDNEVKKRLGLKENYAWRVAAARRELRAATKRKRLEDFVTKILYRPFDERFIFWHPSVVWKPRTEAMPHLLAGWNQALCIGRAGQVIGSSVWDVLFASTSPSDLNLFRRGGNCLFPLYLYPGVGKADGSLFSRWAKG